MTKEHDIVPTFELLFPFLSEEKARTPPAMPARRGAGTLDEPLMLP
jgi:hypothetical protein